MKSCCPSFVWRSSPGRSRAPRLATICCRWDNKSKWQACWKSITAPWGPHTLYYFAQNEAGHKEKVKTLQVNVAQEKAKAPARPAAGPRAQGLKQ